MLLSPRCLLSIILLIIVAGLVYLLWPQQRVQISFEDEHCLLRESSFSLVWQHSVEHQQWRENYRLLVRCFITEASYIETFGAGTPSSGQLIEAPEGFIGFESGLRLPVIHWMCHAICRVKLSALRAHGQSTTQYPINIRKLPLSLYRQHVYFFWLEIIVMTKNTPSATAPSSQEILRNLIANRSPAGQAINTCAG